MHVVGIVAAHTAPADCGAPRGARGCLREAAGGVAQTPGGVVAVFGDYGAAVEGDGFGLRRAGIVVFVLAMHLPVPPGRGGCVVDMLDLRGNLTAICVADGAAQSIWVGVDYLEAFAAEPVVPVDAVDSAAAVVRCRPHAGHQSRGLAQVCVCIATEGGQQGVVVVIDGGTGLIVGREIEVGEVALEAVGG